MRFSVAGWLAIAFQKLLIQSTPRAAYEAAAADVPARLETAINAQQITPRRQPVGLALEQAPNITDEFIDLA